MEEPSEKNLHRQDGSNTPSLAESKSRTPHEPLGSSPFPVLDPSPPKGGEAEAGGGCYRDGWRNKAGTQASGGPEASRLSSPPGTVPTEARHEGIIWYSWTGTGPGCYS